MALLSARPPQQHRHPRARIAPARPLRRTRCSAVAVTPKTTAGIRWGSTKLQGRRSEMEDDLVVLPEALRDFSFAAVFDGHSGFSSVEFLREELFQKCNSLLQDGLLLSSRNFDATRDALLKAFNDVDEKLHIWLEETGKEAESGSTATLMFLRSDFLIVSHVGDSSVVISRGGSADTVTESHRPYGRNRVSLEEIKRIRASGGWISDGRVCGDLAVSRAFGDFRFKTRKNEMLINGVKDGRWTQKFISRIQFKGDLIIPTPDICKVDLGPDVEFIILATDGLWDYMKSSEVVAFVRNQLRQHGDAQLACEALAQTALDRRSEDNVSIVIADLGKRDWKNLPLEARNIFYELGQALATIGVVSLGVWITMLLSSP